MPLADNYDFGTFTLNGSEQQFKGAGAPASGGQEIMLVNRGVNNVHVAKVGNTGSQATRFTLLPGESLTLEMGSPSKLRLLGTNGDTVGWVLKA